MPEILRAVANMVIGPRNITTAKDRTLSNKSFSVTAEGDETLRLDVKNGNRVKIESNTSQITISTLNDKGKTIAHISIDRYSLKFNPPISGGVPAGVNYRFDKLKITGKELDIECSAKDQYPPLEIKEFPKDSIISTSFPLATNTRGQKALAQAA